jgi:hypothetical protein
MLIANTSGIGTFAPTDIKEAFLGAAFNQEISSNGTVKNGEVGLRKDSSHCADLTRATKIINQPRTGVRFHIV